MRTYDYPKLNVLCVLWAETQKGRCDRITPYRVDTEDGRSFNVKEVRHYTVQSKGSRQEHYFVVHTENNYYLDLLFDEHTMIWYLLGEKDDDGVVRRYD